MEDAKSKGFTEKVGPGDHMVHTEIEIDAPADVVWATLTDFDTMSEWSSSLQRIEGSLGEGAEVVAYFRVLGRDRAFEHTIIEFEDGVQWAWSDPLALGMVDHHTYRVEPLADSRCRFVQTDRATGGAAPVLGKATVELDKTTYQKFNQELKQEAERRYRET